MPPTKYIRLAQIPPGLYRNGTAYQAANRWYNGQLVRFFTNTVRPVGGWTRLLSSTGSAIASLSGIVRSVLAWVGSSGSVLYTFGTLTHLYAVVDLALADITPAGLVPGQADAGGTIAGGYGSGAYGSGLYGTGAGGAQVSDPDTWSLDVFGSYMVGVLTSDTNLYAWDANATHVASPPSWGCTSTGSLVTSGSTAAGSPTIVITASTLTGTIFAGQTFEIGGVVYTAQAAATAVSNLLTVTVQPLPAATIATATAVTGTANQAPQCRAVVTTPEQFLVAIGAYDETLSGLNAKLVAWADQGTTSVWGPLATNQAGSFTLTTKGRLLTGLRTKTETLLFTDSDLWRMVYVGGQFVYGFTQAGDECGVISPNAKVAVDSGVYWMGRKSFYIYDGFVKPLACDVADYVFTNLNDLQRAKIWAMVIPQYGEIWWFYPSLASNEIDSYVAYSYREGHWTTGALSRTAGAPDGPIQYPVMVDTSGAVWQHENGFNHQGISPAPFVESGPIEAQYPIAPYASGGENVLDVQRIVPDEKTLGSVTMQVAVSLWPTDAYTFGPSLSVAAPTDVRMSGRLVRLRFTQATDADWRVGAVRLGVKLAGPR